MHGTCPQRHRQSESERERMGERSRASPQDPAVGLYPGSNGGVGGGGGVLMSEVPMYPRFVVGAIGSLLEPFVN